MGKFVVSIQGYGDVIVKRPRKITKAVFADTIGDAIAQTCQLIVPVGNDSFHPVLGKGGYNWDHVNQRAVVRETQTPSVQLRPSTFRGLVRLRLQGLWRNLRSVGGVVRTKLH